MLNLMLVGVLFGILIPSVELHPSRMMAPGHEMVGFINELNTTWKAGEKWDKHEQFPYYMGLLAHQGRTGKDRLPVYTHEDVENLPESFDARQKWPRCPSIGLIRDQGECASCWAVAATEVMTDRVCIQSGGRNKVQISAEDLLSCCKTCGLGCGSGSVEQAWRYYLKSGIVTGGDRGSKDGCRPYQVPPNRGHANCSGSRPVWNVHIVDTPACETRCRPGYGNGYESDKRHGVYQHHFGPRVEGHSVKLLGWGTENGVPYWLAANSWAAEWGDKGFFKILRGSNECGIEGHVVAGIPKEEIDVTELFN
ncbi:cathepsin B-like isoform X2 [Haemaphysalis longicornis]